MKELMIGFVLLFALIYNWLGGSGDSSKATESASALEADAERYRMPPIEQKRPEGFAPETVVRPVHGEFLAACLTDEHLNRVRTHRHLGERTKFYAMFARRECELVPEGRAYKVLSVGEGTIEIVYADAGPNASDGLWAYSDAFVEAD